MLERRQVSPHLQGQSRSKILDVAIVGMGPSGLYTAWRLLKAPADLNVLGRPAKALRVGIYDTMPEERVGGRLCTQPLPGYPFLAELGGMRFRSNQLIMNGLIEALGLTGQVRPFDFPQRFYFLREHRLKEEDFTKTNTSAIKAVYALSGSERRLLPHQLIELAILNTLKSLDFGLTFQKSPERASWDINIPALKRKLKSLDGLKRLSPKEWAIVQRYGEYRNAHFLHDTGFWDLLQFQLSPGAWHLANDGLGYESIMGNWNASIALPWFLDDFATVDFKTLANGMRSVTDKLYSDIKSAQNVSRHFRHDLSAVDVADDASAEPTFRLHFTDDEQGQKVIVFARSVVLALPKGALVRINLNDKIVARASVPDTAPAGFDRRLWFSDLLHSVDSRALFKLFLGYRRPWWIMTKPWKVEGTTRSLHGKVNTDLPLRQIYYYGRDQWNEKRRESLGISEKEQFSMLMASYSDSHYIEFWSELGREKGWQYKKGIQLTPPDEAIHEEFGAPLSMIVRAEHQLGLLHGRRVLKGEEEPQAEIGLYMEWSRPPYYAGWHSWKVGVKPWEIWNTLMRPFGDMKLFICGEAYSSEQGWAEGALKSAERLLSLVFQIPLPDAMRSRFNGDDSKLKSYIEAF